MCKIMIHGMGAMGKMVDEYYDGEKIYFDPSTDNLTNIDASFDVIIDFSHHSVIVPLLDFAKENQMPLVICTTGLSSETEEKILEYSKEFPIFKSGNMSLGINVLLELAKLGAKSLKGFDIEIIEKHHNKKVDAPSGTAFMIAEAIKSIQNLTLEHGRVGTDAKRKDNTIGMHAVRGGTITGEHTVLFAGIDEIIELKHQASSKAVFAKGAIEAALYLVKKTKGLYNMSDLLKGELS
ncbi:4-hydroxy-tetrahydrodipicolinate reductase [Acidaminobacter sp. JC074]|uniref:4-hydroxy-tetrahydrodipicolinate reductase n=1 Tax=Acidaminobacter sp. JC074 TaxID=2530199 RepID=UPI001F0D1E96|nr:4-hydroxy-tetrahydrodipicolinate reductase [Acidaminobacter sp. JC074]MCH4891269.1 4-hydroxy-tetrahydrodipicolinate reductase [Acidaminobacter sp. JC074]